MTFLGCPTWSQIWSQLDQSNQPSQLVTWAEMIANLAALYSRSPGATRAGGVWRAMQASSTSLITKRTRMEPITVSTRTVNFTLKERRMRKKRRFRRESKLRRATRVLNSFGRPTVTTVGERDWAPSWVKVISNTAQGRVISGVPQVTSLAHSERNASREDRHQWREATTKIMSLSSPARKTHPSLRRKNFPSETKKIEW